MQFKIEKGVPIPDINREREGITTVLRQMEIGDSFVCTRKDLRNVYAAAKRVGIPIITRKVGDDQQRIWRVNRFPKDKGTEPVKRRRSRRAADAAVATPIPPPQPPPSEGPSPFQPDMGG